jgi:hypothetical protein
VAEASLALNGAANGITYAQFLSVEKPKYSGLNRSAALGDSLCSQSKMKSSLLSTGSTVDMMERGNRAFS